jgi:hypothetical protein
MLEALLDAIHNVIGDGTDLDIYIKTFYDNLESDTTVRCIGYRIGLYVDVDYQRPAYELFVDSLLNYLDLYPRHKNYISVNDIINMSYEDFVKYMNKLGITDNLEYRYQNRLIEIGSLY